jgi:hypothetical protein
MIPTFPGMPDSIPPSPAIPPAIYMDKFIIAGVNAVQLNRFLI